MVIWPIGFVLWKWNWELTLTCDCLRLSRTTWVEDLRA